MYLVGIFLSTLIFSAQGNPLNFGDNEINDKEYMFFPDGNGTLHLIHLRPDANQYKSLARYNPIKHVHFQLYTRKNQKKPQKLNYNDLSTVKKSNFDPSKQTFVISHGWKNELNSPVNVLILQAYMNTEDANVIVVDWEHGASYNYVAARDNAAATGTHLGQFLSKLAKEFKISTKKINLIGHSLGSHVSGFAGKAFKKHNNGQKVSQIIGLDPALPLYSVAFPKERLNKNDAEYVEIIHTNGGLLGFWDPIGHADFYPNLGFAQPGCGADITGSCAHSRAYEYYAESVERSESFKSDLCSNMDQMNNKSCPQSSNWFLMGGKHYKPKTHGLFYLETSSKSPFGLH